MTWITLACLASLGSWEGEAARPGLAAPEVAAEYRRLRDDSGRGADDHVRLALWSEAHGLAAERARHLALAVLADPAHATARGLLGLVRHDGRWVDPDRLAQANQGDPTRAKLLAEYDARRSTAPYTAQGQWAIARWADSRGLAEQARAHRIAVTRLDPGHEAAWHQLGYRKHRGGWATDAQIAAEKAEVEAQRLADHRWRPLLERCRQMLHQPGRRGEALPILGAITDPRAVSSIVHVFGGDKEVDQFTAVQILGQIESPLSSRCLAQIAVASDWGGVRSAALDRLARRDIRDFVDPLIRLVRAPLRGTVYPVAGPGSIGELAIEGEDFKLRALVRPPLLSDPTNPQAPEPDPSGPAARARSIGLSNSQWNLPGVDLLAEQQKLKAREMAQVDRNNVEFAERALKDQVQRVETINAEIQHINQRVLPVLTRITGQDFGTDRRAWTRWSIDHAGYASQAGETTQKPTIIQEIPVAYEAQLPPPMPKPVRTGPFLPDFSAGHHSCFAAGTPVRTLDGARPIETIRPGDQVLVQDGRTGALSYQAVVAAFHNPPAATLRVRLGDDEVVATGIHRFWKAGVGWTMARDLKPGDLLRVLGGTVAVAGVEPDRVQPVFNLEVAEGRSFFAGRLGALVHDNSPVEATPEPFDAARSGPGRTVAP